METENVVPDIIEELPEEHVESIFTSCKLPNIVEASKIYVLLPKNIPISRAARLQWLLDHINTVITVSPFSELHGSNDLKIISAIPHEDCSIVTSNYVISSNTKVEFFAQSYRFVYCLDMSPSLTAVDVCLGEILFDEIITNFKTSLWRLCEQFTIPGNQQIFQPCVYLTVIVNTPFFISPAQQVLVKGVQISSHNVQDIIYSVQAQFQYIEGRIAYMSSLAYDQIAMQESEEVIGKLFDVTEPECISNIPVVSADANFVNMLRYSMLAISLLPENSLSHIIIITDGVVAMPDSNIMESILFQLHYDSISLSFLKVGSSFNPHVSAGYVSYSDLLHFLSHSTLGTCLEVIPPKQPFVSMNTYQELFFLWSFNSINQCNPQSLATSGGLCGNGIPPLLCKKQIEDDVNVSFILLLNRRMREGYSVNKITLNNGLLEIRLSLHWKTHIFIQYIVTSQWPIVKTSMHYEIHVTAPYDFLHDITCLMKKETKSSYRHAVFERCWIRLIQLASNDVAEQLSIFYSSNKWYCIPDSIKSGIPLFILNENTTYDSTKSVLPNDKSCPKFSSVWQPICQIEISNWRKWFHVHKLSFILRHDEPLPKHIHLTNSSGRFDIIQCRQAATALYDFLAKWSTFILIDNHTYVKLLDVEYDAPLFCLIRVTSKFPSATLNIAFITGTSGLVRSTILDELKQELSSLSYFSLSHKCQETTCCTLLQKPLEKICIRYERMPNDFHTVIFPDGTQPPHSLQPLPSSPFAGTLFTTLSRYLFHQRWIWSANHPSNSKLEFSVVSRILTTLTRMRLKEGFHFAHSASGIITMVLELKMNPVLSCVVQYVLFPPHNEDVHSSSEDEQEYDTETELKIVTEIWIEPQFGTVTTNQVLHLRYMENKYYYELSEEIRQSDLNCINSLLTLEYLSLMCQQKKNLVVDNTSHMILNRRQNCGYKTELSDNSSSNEDTASVWIPILVQRIQHIAYYFNPISILTHCQQTELLFSMFLDGYDDYRIDTEKSNNLLLKIIHSDFLSLHDQELEISAQDCIQFMEQLVLRHDNNNSHNCPLPILNFKESTFTEDTVVRWRCFLKVVSVTHVILTFLPASLQDIQNLIVDTKNDRKKAQQTEGDIENMDNSLLLPTYVFNCPLKMLVDSCVNIHDMDTSHGKDIFEDHRFVFQDDVEKEQSSSREFINEEDKNDVGCKNGAKQHCNTLVLTHYKCFATSIYLALHKELYVHSLNVQAAMDHCDETVYEIDITQYLQTVCGHLKQHDDVLQISTLSDLKPCNDLKQIHSLIKEKFLEITNIAFSAIPTHKEFYYCHNFDSKLSDSNDEISNSASDIVDFKSDSNISSSVQLNRQSSTNLKQVSPLFLHYVCTVRYNGAVTHMSVMVLPTCLGELLQSIDDDKIDIEDLDKSKIQITLDILCLTLPLNIQNIISGYANKSLRTTSMCSDGYQRSISDSTEMSCNSSYNLDFKDDTMMQIPESQRFALNKLFEEIKWLLKDEIVTSLLDIEPVTIDSLKFVMQHISESIVRSSCMLEVIDLNFVHKSCYEKFVKEFCKITIPCYKLCRVDELYYLSKSIEENDDTKSDDNFLINTSNDDTKSKFMSQSDFSSPNTSILGNDDGCEEGDDYNWLLELHNKRQNLPNFWLIMEIQHEVVKIYFHCRFLELKTNYVNKYIKVQKSICDAVRNLCKHVNQYLLLQSLHNTRNCHILLEPKDNGGDWQGDTSAASISKSPIYQLRASDEINDDADQYRGDLIETSLFKFKPGYFSCPVVWQTHFLLHTRLKTGPGKSSLSTGISALKSVLDKFSVSNRNNMFVYQDKNLNVFYLRTHEHLNYLCGRKSNEFENVSRSPSVVSLPIVQPKSLPLTENLTDFRPHVRSFGEKDIKEEQQEDTIVLKVHGITYPEKDVKCELTEVLQNRLDDAVLDILSIMLARNSMCPLTPEDVHFLQKPFSSPEHTIKVSIQNYAVNLLEPFKYYLRQNLLQFLNVPKYTDTRPHYHFKDYTDCDQSPNKDMEENIFIYNQSQSPSSGNRGISCITLAIIDHLKNFAFTTNIEELFLNKTRAEIVESRILQDDLPDIYLEFRLWNQGRVNVENLSQKLCSAACQANWDIIMEYFLLITPLCTHRESFKPEQLLLDQKLLFNHPEGTLNVKEIQKQVVLDAAVEKCNLKHRIVNYDLKLDRMNLNRKYKTTQQKVSSKERKLNSVKPNVKVNSFESGEEGVLSAIYSKSLQYWLNFAVNLKVPSVKSHTILLRNHHPLNTTVKELQTLITQLSQDGVKTYTPDIIDDVHVPFNTASFATTCILIARDFVHWKLCIDEKNLFEHLYPNVLKHTQKFEPMIVNDGKCIYRQKILWAVINSSEIVLYIYNWSKDNMDKLIKQVENLGMWLTIRRSLLSSMTAQKLGLFYDQVINRESLLINNPYLCSIGDVDCMLKFSKERTKRNVSSGVRDCLITLLESFKDTYKIIEPYTDPIGTYMWEMYDIKQSDKKSNDDLKKISSMYKSKSSIITSTQIQIIKQYSRTIHYCHTPLLFLPRWRLEAARTRDHTIVTPTDSGACNSSLFDLRTDVDESWHYQLCIHFVSEYIYYLKTLGFMSLQIESVEKKMGYFRSLEKPMENIYFMQKTILGGILIFTIEFREPFFITKLHAIEYSRLKSNVSYSAVNQIMQSFLDECDKIKILMHLHSFTYDFHLRCVRNYISDNNNNKLRTGYNVTQFLDDFMKYYSKAPNYARNLVHTDTVIVPNLSTEGKQLYNYLLTHIKQYNFDVFTMCDDSSCDETEYILVQISNTQVSYSDSQDRQLKDDFHVTLIVTNVTSQTDAHSLHLKYYLILTSKSREIYPKNDVERKLGQFKTVLSLRKIVSPDESTKDKEIKATTQSEYDGPELDDTFEEKNESYDQSDDKENLAELFDERKPSVLRSHVEIKQESVNYLGYYSSHEQLMQQFMSDCAAATQKSLTDMTVQGTIHCRTHLLWNKLLSSQESHQLSYTEFTELKSFAKLENLCQVHPNLELLLNQPFTWYQNLAKLLPVKYTDQHRLFVSPDGNIQYYVVLHPRYVGAFMMLAMDLHTSRGDLYAVYRLSRYFEDSDLCIRERKALIDGFINFVCFFIWTDMI